MWVCESRKIADINLEKILGVCARGLWRSWDEMKKEKEEGKRKRTVQWVTDALSLFFYIVIVYGILAA